MPGYFSETVSPSPLSGQARRWPHAAGSQLNAKQHHQVGRPFVAFSSTIFISNGGGRLPECSEFRMPFPRSQYHESPAPLQHLGQCVVTSFATRAPLAPGLAMRRGFRSPTNLRPNIAFQH
jgi:hypothetical protein